MGKFKDFLGIGEPKGPDCITDEETGIKKCRGMVKHGNQKFATGSEESWKMNDQCEPVTVGRSSVFEDDEGIFEREKQKDRRDCRGGIN